MITGTTTPRQREERQRRAGGDGDEDTFELLVLYGSQTGNAESAAERLSQLAPSGINSTKITSRHLQLDDFLLEENPKCGWTRLVVIITSSYGVGQAPLGCQRFRELCDRILDDSGGGVGEGSTRFLEGVKYAMLGLGDSSYTTYFENPRTVDRALTRAGAVRVGELGRADAIGGEDGVEETREQNVVIEEWTEDIWDKLNEVLAEEPTEDLDRKLRRARTKTLEICRTLFPDEFDDDAGEDDSGRKKVDGRGGGWWSPTLWSSAAVALLGVVMVALRRRGGGDDDDGDA